jgi:hypothetical protein
MVLEGGGVGDTDIYGVGGWRSGRLIFMVLEVGGVGEMT